jgi:hypothetical protein
MPVAETGPIETEVPETLQNISEEIEHEQVLENKIDAVEKASKLEF